MSNDGIVLNGEVVEVLGGGRYKVTISGMDGVLVDVYVSGKMKKNNIKIIPGDAVQIELNPYDMTKGRIIYRGLGSKGPSKDSDNKGNVAA